MGRPVAVQELVYDEPGHRGVVDQEADIAAIHSLLERQCGNNILIYVSLHFPQSTR
jgi:hypothetical protein